MYNDHVNCDISKEEFRNLCKTVWEKPHDFVVIDLSSKKNGGKYRRGLDDFCIPKRNYNYILMYKKMERELLEKIALNTEPKELFQIVLSDNKARFTTQFNPHIQLKKNKGYAIALVNLETYYSFPNITVENCCFMYSPDEGQTWFVIFVPEGSYDIEDINKVIQQKITENGHSNQITIWANLENGYHVDFRPPDSISSVLGFNNDLYTTDYQESENPVNILSVNSIVVNIYIISGSYVNGQRYPTIYSFFPGVSPRYKIIETPANLVYLPVTLDAIYSMQTSLTNLNGKLLNLRGENASIKFHVREI